MNAFAKVLPHVVIVLSGIVMILAILDRTNPSVGYLTNTGTWTMLLALCVASIANAIMLVARQRQSK